MDIAVRPGRYIIAVSGGIDSMVLLRLLRSRPGLTLTVAHFNHGIRPDSNIDQQLVREVTHDYALPFVTANGSLGPDASEAAARKARYEFLERVRDASGASGIITAHHQDDLLETAVINLLRGTNRRGLSSLTSTDHRVRPLLEYDKQAIRRYAAMQGLRWREDVTNNDPKFLRNHVRKNILSKFSPEDRRRLLELIRESQQRNELIEAMLINHLHVRLHNEELDRKWFIQLPHVVAKEVIYEWLRRHGIRDVDSPKLERITVAAKTYRVGRIIEVDKLYRIKVTRTGLALQPLRPSH